MKMTQIHTTFGAVLLTALALTTTAAADSPPEARTEDEVVKELNARLAKVWQEATVKPARPTKMLEFFRRASLDATGVVPQEETVLALSSRRRSKKKGARRELIEALLHTPEFSRFMATRWANLLVGRGALLNNNGYTGPALVKWLSQQFAANTRWDVVARSLITATGKTTDNGATMYLLRYRNKPEEMAGNLMRVFQGQQVQCAQCHDHPYKTNWKQKDFWGVAAFFARTKQKRNAKTNVYTLVETQNGEVKMPANPGEAAPQVEPRFITGESIDPGEGDYRREELARIVTSPKNPWFVRATVNRVWSFFFGAGFTDPNDLSKPDLPTVLALLEADFRSSGYDMRRLVSVILRSEAYQRSSTGTLKGKDEQVAVFARSRLRPLTVEQLWWSSLQATDYDAVVKQIKDPKDPMAGQKARRNFKRQFFRVFGRGTPDGATGEYDMSQALALLNGPSTNNVLWLRPSGKTKNLLMERLLKMRSPTDQITVLYRRILARAPSRAEKSALGKGGGSSERAQYLQDVAWALMNSSEFLYNH